MQVTDTFLKRKSSESVPKVTSVTPVTLVYNWSNKTSCFSNFLTRGQKGFFTPAITTVSVYFHQPRCWCSATNLRSFRKQPHANKHKTQYMFSLRFIWQTQRRRGCLWCAHSFSASPPSRPASPAWQRNRSSCCCCRHSKRSWWCLAARDMPPWWSVSMAFTPREKTTREGNVTLSGSRSISAT